MNNFKKISAILLAIIILSSLAGCTIKSNHSTPSTTTTSTTASSESTSLTTSTTTTTTKIPETSTTTQKPAPNSTASQGYPYAYAGFNPKVTNMDVPFNLVLLNRDYCLPDGYVPPLAPAVKGSDAKLHIQVAPYYQQMYDAAKLDGITLTPISGYRSFQRQKRNFEMEISNNQKAGMSKIEATKKAAEIRLLPGTSEHNAGLAMDICSLSTKFDQTKEFQWLQEHAHEYGFIMRYPKDKTHITKITYEPWHYRYVGVELAQQLKQSGQVLEEILY